MIDRLLGCSSFSELQKRLQCPLLIMSPWAQVCVFLQVDTKRWNLLDHRVGTALLDAARLPSTVAVTNHSPDAF